MHDAPVGIRIAAEAYLNRVETGAPDAELDEVFGWLQEATAQVNRLERGQSRPRRR